MTTSAVLLLLLGSLVPYVVSQLDPDRPRRELKARLAAGLADCTILKMVTSDAAHLLRLPQAGALRPGAYADLVVMPAGESALSAAIRAS